MANKLANRVKVTVSGTPGTGTITLGSAVSGFMDFATAGVSNGNTVPYVIEDSNAWEIGVGTYTSSGTTLARTSITASSSGGTAISATSNAIVMISPLAADLQAGTAANNLVQLDGTGKIPALDGSLITSLNATNITNGTLSVSRGGTGLTSLTAGYIPFGNGTSAFNTSSNLYFNGSQLGIGTSSPLATLDVQAAGYQIAKFTATTGTNGVYFTCNNTGGDLHIGRDSSTGGVFGIGAYVSLIYSAGAYPFAFAVNGYERMRIASDGSVGIGTTSPLARIDSRSTGTGLNAYGQLFVASTDSATADVGGTITLGGSYSGTSTTYFASIGGYKENTTSGNFAGYLAFATRVNGGSALEKMRLDSAGNLGLGVTPSAWNSVTAFQIKNASFGGYSNYSYLYANAYYSSGWKYIASDLAAGYEQNSGQHRWFIAPSGTAGAACALTQAMTLDASGRLGIGTTNPTANLSVLSSGTYSGGSQKRNVFISAGDGAGTAGGIYLTSSTASGGNAAVLEAVGQRTDGNGSSVFSGNLLLGHLRTDAPMSASGMSLGRIGFGGNPTGTSLSNVLYSAQITAYSDGAWSSSSAMPTALVFNTGSSGVDANAYTGEYGTERMRIDSAGNVGIGTTSPSSYGKFASVNGNSYVIFNGGVYNTAYFGPRPANDGYCSIYYSWGTNNLQNMWISDYGSTTWNVSYNTSGTTSTLFSIASSGLVGIGTASPAVKLHVVSTSAGNDIISQSTAAAGSGAAYLTLQSDAGPSSTYYRALRCLNNAGTTSWVVGQWGAPNDTLCFYTGSGITERARFNAGSSIFCLAGGSTTATGTGIAFPATQSASSDANTLDDYEEGDWTPSLNNFGASPSYTLRVGKYVKVGKNITIMGVLVTNSSSVTGTLSLNIPFVGATYGSLTVDNSGSGIPIFAGRLNTGSTTVEFKNSTNAGITSGTGDINITFCMSYVEQ